VVSCDWFSDVWPVFFTLFFRYWPDCPFDMYLGSNYLRYEHPQVTTMTVGEDTSWAHGARLMLESLSSEYVLLFLEDFLLTEPVDSDKVISLWELLKALDGNCLLLRPDSPSVERALVPGHPEITEVMPGELWRVSLGVAIWKRSVLLSLLRDGESAWDMEWNGSRRSDDLPGFYSTVSAAIVRNNGLEGGKWKRYNLPLLRREGIAIPPGHPVMTSREDAMTVLIAKIHSVPWAHTLARIAVRSKRRLVGLVRS
jgi:hypothetical protein